MPTRAKSAPSFLHILPWITVGIAGVAALVWLIFPTSHSLQKRLPGSDAVPTDTGGNHDNPVLKGSVIPGPGQPADLPGPWPQFRGPNRDGKLLQSPQLARSWPGGKPRELWSVEAGEGYAGPAVADGRVFLMDYDREGKQDALRCLSLADGREIWRFAYPATLKRNHGMTRTVPAISATNVVAISPKCLVICCNTKTGALRWTLDLVSDFGATVPEWYTGQCPLVDGDHVILAPGGPEALLIAVSVHDGSVLWKTPNPNGLKMTHSSIMPWDFGGVRQYIYCANKGVVGVSAENGSLLWQTTDWKISIATVPSPCILDQGRVFFTGGYNAGSLMLQLVTNQSGFSVKPLFRLNAETFGPTQHTPIVYQNQLYGIRADGQLVCLSLDGKVLWASGKSASFGLGPLLIADGLIYALEESGLLKLVEATPSAYHPLAEAQVLNGREAWGPMALAGNRLLVRDFTRLTCLDVGSR